MISASATCSFAAARGLQCPPVATRPAPLCISVHNSMQRVCHSRMKRCSYVIGMVGLFSFVHALGLLNRWTSAFSWSPSTPEGGDLTKVSLFSDPAVQNCLPHPHRIGTVNSSILSNCTLNSYSLFFCLIYRASLGEHYTKTNLYYLLHPQ